MRDDTTRRRFLSSVGLGGSFVGVGGYGSKQAKVQQQTSAIQRTNDPEIDVGAVYIPFLESKWGSCVDHEPQVGQYGIGDISAIDQQLEWMKENGITTVMFNFGEGYKDFDRFRAFRRANLVDDLNLEVFWAINRIFQRDLDIERFLDFIRSEFLKRDNYNRYNGRPVIQFWGAAYLRWDSNTRENIIEEYGSLADFVDYIRDRLTLGGTNPYLVAHEPGPSQRPGYARAFDGYTGWFGPLGRLGQPTWEEFLAEKRKIADRVSSFATDNSKDYLPMVVPGFDDRPNDCWGEDRYVPRSPENLAEMFEFADEYRTRARVNLATFNDWTEGHQIEPGTFSGSEYGLEYLQVVKNYVESTSTSTKSEPQTETPTTTTTVKTSSTPATDIETQTKTTTVNGTSNPKRNDTSSKTPGFSMLSGLTGIATTMAAYYWLNTLEERNS